MKLYLRQTLFRWVKSFPFANLRPPLQLPLRRLTSHGRLQALFRSRAPDTPPIFYALRLTHSRRQAAVLQAPG